MIGADRRAWVAGPALRPAHATVARTRLSTAVAHAGLSAPVAVVHASPGTPVAVGPRSAGEPAVARAVAELDRLVTAGGRIAAGAGVDLGDGFRSARTEGGPGDRRDAVLAALTIPGLREDRLGEPLALLVALFGPAATRPLGATARAAIAERRWSVLRFAAAASDVLGPEQLVRLLELRAPAGVEPFAEGLPSVVGGHLARVLRDVPATRRLTLLTDLWEQVCDFGSVRVRRERLLASQGRIDRVADLKRRRARYVEDELNEVVRRELGSEPTMPRLALWRPDGFYWRTRAEAVFHDAIAATVLARLAVAAVDHGVDGALTRHGREIEAALSVAGLSAPEAAASARVLSGHVGLPARPGSYLREIRDIRAAARLSRASGRSPAGAAGGPAGAAARSTGEPGPSAVEPGRFVGEAGRSGGEPGAALDERRARRVTQLLAHARDYAIVVLAEAADLLTEVSHDDSDSTRAMLGNWANRPAHRWHDNIGFLSPGRLPDWDQPPLLAGDAPTLAARLRAAPDRPPAEVETIADLFWLAELADALARLRGHAAAEITPGDPVPAADTEPRPPVDPLVPRPESIPRAVAATAHLVGLAGAPPRAGRTWPELLAELFGGAPVAAAMTGAFPVPAPIAAADGAVVPRTDARVEVAQANGQLATWAEYMGNCIAGLHYTGEAAAGRSALLALRGPDDRILANVELRPTAHGWRITEIRARFNADPDAELLARTRTWVAGLPRAAAGPPVPAHPARFRARHSAAQRTPGARLAQRLGPLLGGLVTAAVAEPGSARAVATMALVAVRPAGAGGDPFDALTALRRLDAAGLVAAVRRALSDPDGPAPGELWRATGGRPLERAMAGLPAATARQLAALLVDEPLPGALGRLARLPEIAPGRTAHLVALRLRAALGTMIRRDTPELAHAVADRPFGPLLRAAALAVTAWGGLAPAHADADSPAVARAGAADESEPPASPTGAVTVVCPPRHLTVPGHPATSLTDALWLRAWPDAVDLGAEPGRAADPLGVEEAASYADTPAGTSARLWDAVGTHGLLLPTSWLPVGGWPALWARTAHDH